MVAALGAVMLTVLGSATAAPGELDPSFGVDGLVLTDAAVGHVVVQGDGKIVTAGTASPDSWVLARYLPDGSPDESFGVDGQVVSSAPGGIATGLASAPDGTLIVAGSGVVVRYLSSGALDESFGEGGVASIGLARFGGIVVFPDGSMVLAGTSHGQGSDFVAVRLAPSGARDPSFGVDGAVVTDLGGSEGATAVLALPDGKFVAAGERADGAGADFALVRYLPDGSLDPTFGTGGKVITDIGGPAVWDHGDDAVMAPDGKIVVVGASYPNIALARYLSDGSLDPTFGTGGTVVSQAGEAWSVAQQSDAKLVVTTGELAAARFTANGALDDTFGNGGIADAGLPGTGGPVALDARGRVLMGGRSEGGFVLARFLGDPIPPENDTFADALVLDPVMTFPLLGTNALATKEIGEPWHGSDEGGASVWYRWTPAFSGTGFVSTAGSDFDTLLGVYTGTSVASLLMLASNDDAHEFNSPSVACFPVTTGATYPVAVDGYAAARGYEGGQGDIELSWGEYTSGDPCPMLPPTVLGNPVVGGTLTAINGTWAGLPAGFEYQWQRCRGITCSLIPDATAMAYKPTLTDVGTNLGVRVIAKHPTDPSLDAHSYSTRTGPVPQPPSPPPSGGGGGGGSASIPNLTLSLSASKTTLAPGEESDIVATIANIGGAGSLQTHLKIALPTPMALLGPPAYERGSGCVGTQAIDCSLDYLPNGGTTKVWFAVRVTGTGPQSLTATVSADRDSNPANNTATLTLQVVPPPTPGPKPALVKPVIGRATIVPAPVRAGKTTAVSFKVTRSDTGARLTSGRMICDPSIGGKQIRHREQFTRGVATLRFTVPKTAKGKLLKVRLTIKLGTQSTTRISTFRVR